MTEDEDRQSWSDEGDWYIRMIIDSYEEELAERDERIRELASDVEYYKYEAGRTW